MSCDLTFVIPFLDEAGHLQATMDSLARQELGPFSAEVLLVDGMSTDGSAELARARCAAISTPQLDFRVLENPGRRAPFAFNLGIQQARGRYVGFGGAHSDYPPHYFRTAIELLDKGVADVVGGGHDEHRTSSNGPLARAMSHLYRSRIGSGVAAYHRRRTPGFVDTVYGGFYRREVFDAVGGFNVRLTRNQDNELNARVVSSGRRIYFDPRLSTSYVMKTDFRTFFRRGFMFGRYHPETWAANLASFRLRHVIPGLAVVYLAVALGLAANGWYHALAPLALYAVLLAGEAVRIARSDGPAVGLLTIPLFSGYHLSYGLGTMAGLGYVAASLARGSVRRGARAERA